MTIMNERMDLVRFARRARTRQGLVRSVEVSLRALFYALCASLAGLVAAKLFGLTIPVHESVIGLATIVGIAGLLALVFPRQDILESAAEVDERAGWKERLSSALALPALNHPMEHALVEDVREKLKQQKTSALFPLRAPRELKLTPVIAIAIAAVSYFVPQVDLLGYVARDKDKKKQKEEISLAIEKLEHRKKELEKNDRTMEKVKDAIKKIDALANELQKNPPPDRKDAIAQISKLSDELQQLKDELGKNAAMAEKVQKAASEKGGDSGELGKLLREGRFAEAVQELAKMRNALQEGKLSPAEREKLRKQMESLAEKMQKDKSLNEMEKKLAEAMKGMQDGDEKGLDGLQKELGKMENELNESEQLAEALKDLENLTDALAKGEGECPKCGEKKGKCKCKGDGLEGDKKEDGEPGDGLGEGKGTGPRPENPTEFDTEKSKVKSKLGKGTYVGSYFMKGEPPKGEAATQYSEVERAYAEEAMDALNKQKIPALQRDYVRDYFDAIRLEKTGKSK